MRTRQEQAIDTSVAEATSISSVANLIDKALRTYGCDPEPLFTEAGIDHNVSFDPNARIPITKVQTLWKLSVEATGDQGFGLTAAEQFQPAALHGLGFAWLASDTLRDALGRLVRFSRLLNTYVKAYLDDSENTVDLVILGPEVWPNFVHAAADMGMATFLRMCQITVGAHIAPVCVILQRPTPPCVDRFNAFFAAPIEYGAPDNRLCFEPHLVNQPLMTNNPELARINDQTVIDYLARFDRSTITMKVRAHIIEQLPSGTPNQASIADALHVSLRSLQRKLKDEEITFKTLLEDTRQKLAMQYLRAGHRSVGEIAYLLGFSEPGNFTRAFRRWTGYSPVEFREIA
ncbi:MAG: AraC family transcriptional regulator [Pseudomonadota bacterium]|nr:AraC family transcriptional regulator [Pseudomonadota bacterium]